VCGNFSSPDTSFVTSLRGVTPPVGFAGEFKIMRRVLSVTKERASSPENAKPFSSRTGIGMGVAPVNSIMERYMGNPGSGYIISQPGSPIIKMAANMVTLPPGIMQMFSGETSTPVVSNVRCATASRKGKIPVAGV